MPIKMIDDNEMVMGKRRGAVEGYSAQKLRGMKEGIAMGESLRQSRIRNEIMQRDQDLQERITGTNERRQAAIDAENLKNQTVEREYKGAVTENMKTETEQRKMANQKAKQEELLKRGIPSFLMALEHTAGDPQYEVAKQNAYLKSIGTPEEFLIKSVEKDNNGGYKIQYNNNNPPVAIPKDRVQETLGYHFPGIGKMQVEKEKIRVQDEKYTKQAEAADRRLDAKLKKDMSADQYKRVKGYQTEVGKKLNKLLSFNSGEMDLDQTRPMITSAYRDMMATLDYLRKESPEAAAQFEGMNAETIDRIEAIVDGKPAGGPGTAPAAKPGSVPTPAAPAGKGASNIPNAAQLKPGERFRLDKTTNKYVVADASGKPIRWAN